MSRFSQGFRTTATQNAVLEIIAGAGSRSHLVELGCMINAQTLTPVGLGYPAAIGVTPTTPVTLLSEADNATIAVTSALAWARRMRLSQAPDTRRHRRRAPLRRFRTILGTCGWGW